MDDERVGFEPGPHHCDECKATFQHTPWAFALMDLRFREGLRFCGEACLNKHRALRSESEAAK